MAAYPSTAAYPPPTGGCTTPSSQVELSISCKKLIRGDVLSKSDPVVAVLTQSSDGKWSEVACVDIEECFMVHELCGYLSVNQSSWFDIKCTYKHIMIKHTHAHTHTHALQSLVVLNKLRMTRIQCLPRPLSFSIALRRYRS